MTTTLGELYNIPTEDAFLNRVKQLIADTYPPGWREWQIRSETPSLDGIDRNRIRFALPTVKLIDAYAPGTRYVTERQFRRMKADLLSWRVGQAFLTRPSTFAIALRPAQADYDSFLLNIKSLKLQILSRERANEVLMSQNTEEELQPDSQMIEMASHPAVDHCDSESSDFAFVDCKLQDNPASKEPSCAERLLSVSTGGSVDGSRIRKSPRSPENDVDDEDVWPEGVEVECKLEEVTPCMAENPPNHIIDNDNCGFSVTVTSACPKRKNTDAAGPSGESLNSSEIHMKSTSVRLAKPYGCELCDYRGKYRSDLEAHMRTHTGEKPFACKLCDYRCTHSSHLKYHMRTHTGEKPFVCTICDYRCIHAGRLRDHMMSHTGEKPYSCDLCDFKCSRTGILKRHLRMHTGEKPYACDICDYRCTETGTLKAHKRTHTGEKPYACDKCDHRSGQLSALRKHQKTHASVSS